MILKFEDDKERQGFLDVLKQERGDILRHCYRAQVLPDVVVSDLDEEQASWLRERLGRRAFDDVQFETF